MKDNTLSSVQAPHTRSPGSSPGGPTTPHQNHGDMALPRPQSSTSATSRGAHHPQIIIGHSLYEGDWCNETFRFERQHGAVHLIEYLFRCVADQKTSDSRAADRTHYQQVDTLFHHQLRYTVIGIAFDQMQVGVQIGDISPAQQGIEALFMLYLF